MSELKEEKEPLFHKVTFRLSNDIYKELEETAKNRDESLAFIIREYISKGMAKDYVEDSRNIITSVVREQVQLALKPSVERLAKISSKAGHMAATATFLNVQALMDLVPKENRKDVREMYEKARMKAVTYMKQRAEDFDNKID